MAEILPFAGAEGHRIRNGGGGAGEIVIFPGVRVEYHESAPASEAKQRARRSRRRGAKVPYQPEAAGSGSGSA